MRENRYDDPGFFERYSKMPRSIEGLQAAGEWPALKQMLPDFTGKRVLDLGCGFGWHCRYAALQGAAQVLGTDISERMLGRARALTREQCIRYQRAAMEELDFAPGEFDVVISSLALHYVEDFARIFRNTYRWLSAGGDFVFSVEHPVFTAYGNQDWYYGESGEKLHWPVDRYFQEGRRDAVFLGEKIVKYHRTLQSYLEGLMRVGFVLRGVVEPEPDAAMLETVPGMRDELRRPMMLLVSARK